MDTPTTNTPAKMSRMETLLKVVFPSIKQQLADEFGYTSDQADADMLAAAQLYASKDGAKPGLDAAQAVVDRGNALLIQEWRAVLEDAVSRARRQYAKAVSNCVSQDILTACNTTLEDVEFLFTPVSPDEPAKKPAILIRELKSSLERVDKVGITLKGEHDRVEAEKERQAEAVRKADQLRRQAEDEAARQALVEDFMNGLSKGKQKKSKDQRRANREAREEREYAG